jgi:hypothetical protein
MARFKDLSLTPYSDRVETTHIRNFYPDYHGEIQDSHRQIIVAALQIPISSKSKLHSKPFHIHSLSTRILFNLTQYFNPPHQSNVHWSIPRMLCQTFAHRCCNA